MNRYEYWNKNVYSPAMQSGMQFLPYENYKQAQVEAQTKEFDYVNKLHQAGVKGIPLYYEQKEDVEWVTPGGTQIVSYLAMELVEGTQLADFVMNHNS